MFSWTSRLNQKPLFLEFSGFYILFSFQGSLLLSHRQLIYIIISNWLCQQLFYFIFNLSQKPVCVSALISSIDLPLSQGRMLWYQSFQGLSTIFLYLLFFLFCCDFLEYFIISIYFTHTRLKNQQHSHQLILILLAEMPLIYLLSSLSKHYSNEIAACHFSKLYIIYNFNHGYGRKRLKNPDTAYLRSSLPCFRKLILSFNTRG